MQTAENMLDIGLVHGMICWSNRAVNTIISSRQMSWRVVVNVRHIYHIIDFCRFLNTFNKGKYI